MTETDPSRPPSSFFERVLSRMEEWIYTLNEQNHWIFKLYDAANEAWAGLFFGGIRRAALDFDVPLHGKGIEARMRLLRPGDFEAFAALLASFDFKYMPPHPLDRETARSALHRKSYLPLGLFHDGELVGYLLLRLFAPKRVVLGIWSVQSYQNRGLTTVACVAAANFTQANGYPNFVTIPLDNTYSLRVVLTVGWKMQRTNSRFHLLRYF
jgi:hypothetical protein